MKFLVISDLTSPCIAQNNDGEKKFEWRAVGANDPEIVIDKHNIVYKGNNAQ